MRVLHIDSEKSWRGGQQQVFSLLTGLRARGHEVGLATPQGSELGARAREAGIEVLGYTGRGSWDPRVAGQLRGFAAKIDPQLVHAHSANAHAIAHGAFRSSHPIVVTRRVDFRIRRNPLSQWRYKHAGTHYIAISEAVKSILLEGGVDATRVSIVHSGIDPARVAGGRREALRGLFLGGHEGPVVGFVGALVEHKDPLCLVRAGVALASRMPGLRIVFIGTGPVHDTPEWKQLVAQTPPGLFFEAGWRTDIADCLAALDLFVMPSVEEGLCTSLLDAQAAGVPCVITAAGGMVEIVSGGENGIVVPPRNPSALAQAIEELWQDAEARTRFAARGREVVRERFTIDSMVDGTAQTYQKVLSAQC